MRRKPDPPPDGPAYEWRVVALAAFIDLLKYRASRDYLKATQAHHELEDLGVSVKFRRGAPWMY